MKLQRGMILQPPISITQKLWSWIGAFTGITLVSILLHYVLDGTGLTLIIGSFAASAIVLCTYHSSVLAGIATNHASRKTNDYPGGGDWSGTAGDDQFTNNAGATVSGSSAAQGLTPFCVRVEPSFVKLLRRIHNHNEFAFVI